VRRCRPTPRCATPPARTRSGAAARTPCNSLPSGAASTCCACCSTPAPRPTRRATTTAGRRCTSRWPRAAARPRCCCSRAAHHETARLLLARTGERDIHLAAALDDLTAAADLLDADPATRDRLTTLDDCLGFHSGGTPLHVAADSGSERVAALLLERGADPNARSLINHTPLHAAAAAGQEDVAALLLLRGADLAARDGRHEATPLEWAAFQQRDDMVAWLKERGAKG
jgi:hypothetical protein